MRPRIVGKACGRDPTDSLVDVHGATRQTLPPSHGVVGRTRIVHLPILLRPLEEFKVVPGYIDAVRSRQGREQLTSENTHCILHFTSLSTGMGWHDGKASQGKASKESVHVLRVGLPSKRRPCTPKCSHLVDLVPLECGLQLLEVFDVFVLLLGGRLDLGHDDIAWGPECNQGRLFSKETCDSADSGWCSP